MFLDKNRIKYLLSLLFKSTCLIIGLDIFLTSTVIVIKREFRKSNIESKNNLIIKNIKFNQNV